MISVSSLYQDAVDAVLKEANGDLSIMLFNRYSRLAELKLIDWLTGDITGRQPPEPYITQKNKDLAAVFIEKFKVHIDGDEITRPDNYYGYENMYVLGTYKNPSDCTDNSTTFIDKGNVPIVLLDGGQFTKRCRTYINELKPSYKSPIAKMVGKKIEFFPKDLGSICLEYYRYPVFGVINTIEDVEYNNEVPNELTSINYEWDENVRTVLLWFIVDLFSNRVSNAAMKQFNQNTSKTGHE